mmetsp:Transcript_137531/g.343151  ORF Transcript_137531/g.343151 Transcript_137531/m.343151 type:complete len:312 (+) Transcript_137531:118-1053(+)
MDVSLRRNTSFTTLYNYYGPGLISSTVPLIQGALDVLRMREQVLRQELDGVLGLLLADFGETVGQGRHYVGHEVLPEWLHLCFQERSLALCNNLAPGGLSFCHLCAQRVLGRLALLMQSVPAFVSLTLLLCQLCLALPAALFLRLQVVEELTVGLHVDPHGLEGLLLADFVDVDLQDSLLRYLREEVAGAWAAIQSEICPVVLRGSQVKLCLAEWPLRGASEDPLLARGRRAVEDDSELRGHCSIQPSLGNPIPFLLFVVLWWWRGLFLLFFLLLTLLALPLLFGGRFFALLRNFLHEQCIGFLVVLRITL